MSESPLVVGLAVSIVAISGMTVLGFWILHSCILSEDQVARLFEGSFFENMRLTMLVVFSVADMAGDVLYVVTQDFEPEWVRYLSVAFLVAPAMLFLIGTPELVRAVYAHQFRPLLKKGTTLLTTIANDERLQYNNPLDEFDDVLKFAGLWLLKITALIFVFSLLVVCTPVLFAVMASLHIAFVVFFVTFKAGGSTRVRFSPFFSFSLFFCFQRFSYFHLKTFCYHTQVLSWMEWWTGVARDRVDTLNLAIVAELLLETIPQFFIVMVNASRLPDEEGINPVFVATVTGSVIFFMFAVYPYFRRIIMERGNLRTVLEWDRFEIRGDVHEGQGVGDGDDDNDNGRNWGGVGDG